MKPNILVVDDDPNILEAVQMILESANFQVRVVQHARLVFNEVSLYKPKLIILDVQLDGFDGREICSKLKSDSKFSHIPIIMFSGTHDLPSIKKHCPVDDFISKPFDMDVMISKVERLLVN